MYENVFMEHTYSINHTHITQGIEKSFDRTTISFKKTLEPEETLLSLAFFQLNSSQKYDCNDMMMMIFIEATILSLVVDVSSSSGAIKFTIDNNLIEMLGGAALCGYEIVEDLHAR
uniref:Uncharacterized protein n=1 Tax=Glossina austeni TaxID=7395 RepID=A0A1A9UCS6_GLOAU